MMNLVYYQPWSLLDRWRHEIDELFTRRSDASLPLPAVTNSTAWRPSVDLQEESDPFILPADGPGVAAKEIEVSADDGTLNVHGERPAMERVNGYSSQHNQIHPRTLLCRITLTS